MSAHCQLCTTLLYVGAMTKDQVAKSVIPLSRKSLTDAMNVTLSSYFLQVVINHVCIEKSKSY